MFLHHKLKACHYLEDWNPQLATFFFLAWSTCLRWLQTKDEPFFLFPAVLSLSLSLHQKNVFTEKFHCSNLFAAVAWHGILISFGNEGCITRCQYNCQHCKQVSGLSLVYLHLHHFLHGLQNSCMVSGVILHHVWSLCNHFEANDIVGVLAAFPVCFLIFSSPDLRNDMPHLLFEEVNIYTALSNT